MTRQGVWLLVVTMVCGGGWVAGQAASQEEAALAAKAKPPTLKTAYGEVAIFPVTNPWNKDVSKLKLHAKSQAWLQSVGLDKPLHPDFGTVWNGAPNGIPFVAVSPTQAKSTVQFEYADESDAGPYPIPPNPPKAGQGSAGAGGKAGTAGKAGGSTGTSGAQAPATGTGMPTIPTVSGDCPKFVNGTITFMGLGGITIVAGTKGDAPSAPMVFYWHGTGSTAGEYASMAAAVQQGVVKEGGVLVSFQGTTGGDLLSGTSIFGAGDFKLADQLLACAVRDHNIDPRRIFTTGCSADCEITNGTPAISKCANIDGACPEIRAISSTEDISVIAQIYLQSVVGGEICPGKMKQDKFDSTRRHSWRGS